MWIFVSRAPRPDAVYWPGRRGLALLDAVAWPVLWAVLIIKAPFSTGILGVVAVSFVAIVAAHRSRTARLRNERYRFTTWRWGIALACAAAVAAASRLMVYFSVT